MTPSPTSSSHSAQRHQLARSYYWLVCLLFAAFFLLSTGLALRALHARNTQTPPSNSVLATQAKLSTEALAFSVVRVIDGDTLILGNQQGIQVKVRLEGIDAPESDQPFGRESKAALSSLVDSQKLKLETKRTDKYGRYLGSLYGRMGYINLILVKSGFAWAYGESPNTHDFLKAQEEAHKNRLGLWKAPRPISPSDWRSGLR